MAVKDLVLSKNKKPTDVPRKEVAGVVGVIIS